MVAVGFNPRSTWDKACVAERRMNQTIFTTHRFPRVQASRRDALQPACDRGLKPTATLVASLREASRAQNLV